MRQRLPRYRGLSGRLAEGVFLGASRPGSYDWSPTGTPAWVCSSELTGKRRWRPSSSGCVNGQVLGYPGLALESATFADERAVYGRNGWAVLHASLAWRNQRTWWNYCGVRNVQSCRTDGRRPAIAMHAPTGVDLPVCLFGHARTDGRRRLLEFQVGTRYTSFTATRSPDQRLPHTPLQSRETQ